MIHLITENYIRDNSPVPTGVDPKDLSSHVGAAQTNFLRPILGSGFYDLLIQKFSNQTLNPEELDLMSLYIQPALLWRTIALALPWIQYNLRNKGFMVNTDDSANAALFQEFKFMINEASGRAKINEELLVKFLCKNSKDFPEFKNQEGLQQPNPDVADGTGLIFY